MDLDASAQVRILEMPQGQITRAEGDVHPLGNPHYWLDPENGKVVAREIFEKLAKFRPNDKAYFEQRMNDFTNRLNEAEKRWVARPCGCVAEDQVEVRRPASN